MSESAQFARFNKIVLGVPEQWDKLSLDQKSGWEILGALQALITWCDWWKFYSQYVHPVSDGEATFKAANLCRALQNETWLNDAPAVSIIKDNDSITLATSTTPPAPIFPLGVHVTVEWNRASAPPVSYVNLLLWQRARMTMRYGLGSQVKYRFIGCRTIYWGSASYLDDLLLEGKKVVPGGTIDLIGLLCQVGLAGFSTVEAQVRNG